MTPRDETLVARLAGDAAPVRRAAPPLRRATIWLTAVAAVAAIVVARLYAPGTMTLRMASGWNYVELGATLATGVAAILAAFNLGVPGDNHRWRWAPLPPLLLWIAATLAGLAAGHSGWGVAGEGMPCFKFVVIAGTPMAVAVIVALRRTLSLEPWRMSFLAGLGVSALATFLLAFCHPFALDPADLVAHLAAIATVTGLVTLLGGPLLKIRPRK
jgi:hypothetical protein